MKSRTSLLSENGSHAESNGKHSLVDERFVVFQHEVPKPLEFFGSLHIAPARATLEQIPPYIAFHGCLDGPIVLMLEDRELKMKSGDLYVVPANSRYQWQNRGRHHAATMMLLVSCNAFDEWPSATGVAECCQSLVRLLHRPRRFSAAPDPILCRNFWQAADRLTGGHRPNPLMLNAFLWGLVGRVVERLQADPSDNLPLDPYAQRIRQVLVARLYDRLSIVEIANAVGVSPTKAKQLFRESYGCAIKTYYTGLKVKEAQRLLETGRYTVERVSNELGFSSPSYFRAVFERHVGKKPSDFLHPADESAGL